MDLWAIIPVKPFAQGKSRLAGVLGAAERAALNRRLFGRVLDATLVTFRPERVVVVTGDALLLALVRGQGLHALQDTDGGLNAALGFACRYAVERGAPAIAVVPSDLPTVTAGDVAALAAALGPAPCCVIAPDEQEQGTNALALTPPDPGFFRYGPASFQAHIEAAKARGMAPHILRRPGLAGDLDTPESYRRYVRDRSTKSGVLA
jgi:2-phospho-L-lactate guanylyltransferase